MITCQPTTPTSKIQLSAYDTPCGRLLLGSNEGKLCLCDWAVRFPESAVERRLCRGLNAELTEQPSDATTEAARQLDEYFAGCRQIFQLPLKFVGTDFQRSVWESLINIPYGVTYSYAELAAHIGMPRATRAVAHAVGANAISIIVPCHRIVGSHGKLTGYAGGLAAKRFLLDGEGDNFCFSVRKGCNME